MELQPKFVVKGRIYVAKRSDGLVKVGFTTKDVAIRLHCISGWRSRAGVSVQHELLFVAEGKTMHEEIVLHRALKSERANGDRLSREVYRPTPTLFALLQERLGFRTRVAA